MKKKCLIISILSVFLIFFNGCIESDESLSLGPYAVGSKTIFIHDYSRPLDSVAGVNSGIRVLPAEIWYPVDKSAIDENQIRAAYSDYVFNDKEVHNLMMYNTTFFHARAYDPYYERVSVQEGVTQKDLDQASDMLFHKKRNSYIKAPIAESETSFPVVIMSHGDAGSRYNMESACEFLAANGYMVIAPEHTGNVPYAMIGKDPAFETDTDFNAAMEPVKHLIDSHGVYLTENAVYGQTSYAFQTNDFLKLDRSIIERINDLRVTIKKIEELNQNGFFKNRIDLESIGLMGRSFGGITTLAGLDKIDRFKAGVSVVPLSAPDIRDYYTLNGGTLLETESAILSSDMDKEPSWTSLSKPTMIMNCREDSIINTAKNICSLINDSIPGSALVPEKKNRFPELKQSFDNTDIPVIWTELENADHGSYGVSSQYWWPYLKRNSFPKVFEPSKEYTLLDSRSAHEIHRKKILYFFDYFLKNDEQAAKKLKCREFKKLGFHIRHKNF